MQVAGQTLAVVERKDVVGNLPEIQLGFDSSSLQWHVCTQHELQHHIIGEISSAALLYFDSLMARNGGRASTISCNGLSTFKSISC